MKFEIFNKIGYVEVKEELNELINLRDRVEENGGSTSSLDDRIDEIYEALSEYRQNHIEEF